MTLAKNTHLVLAELSCGIPALLPASPGHADVLPYRLWHPVDVTGVGVCSLLVTCARGHT